MRDSERASPRERSGERGVPASERVGGSAGAKPPGSIEASIGTSVERVGGIDRVTGAQMYTADLRVHHALQVKLVHVDCAHAKILDIDTAAAERVEGVRYVLSAKTMPQPMPKFGPTFVDRPVIADGEVRFFGETVHSATAHFCRRMRCSAG